jgi:hypothetical protein
VQPKYLCAAAEENCEISGSHGDEYEVDSLLEYGTM